MGNDESIMSDCLFCKIVRKEINAKEVLRDEHVVAFHDLNPQAPVHLLGAGHDHEAAGVAIQAVDDRRAATIFNFKSQQALDPA